MSDIIPLKKRRASIKGSMTKLLNYISTINNSTNAEEIKVRLSNVERYRNEFIEIENKIVALDNDEELDNDFEDNYYRAVAGLNLALRKRSEPTVSLNDTTIEPSLMGAYADVKLPKIIIPAFSGEYTEWQSFHDLFCSTIHDNPRLTPSQKLQYLKGTLKGEASGLLKHFSTTDANYIEALTKLRERYDRRKHTIYAFIKNFMYQPSITTANSMNVRRLLDTSDETIRGLKALGEDAESRDHWLIHIMISKLDDETINLWAQASAEHNLPTLKQFFDFLSRRIDALESVKGQNKRSQSQANPSKPIIKSHAVSTLQGEACVICPTENHKLFECVQFREMPLNERKALITKENRCFNCFNNNHGVYTCRSKFRCRQCGKKHHTLLHEQSILKQESETTKPKDQKNEGNHSSSYTTSNQISSSSITILPTALVRVIDGLNQDQLCRVLLDSGSQGSFVTENCARRLQLKRSCANFAISGIGGVTNGYTKGSVSLIVMPWNKTEPRLQIEAFVFPKLTARPSTSQSINVEFFNQYELADPYFYKGLEIDIIIGADGFFELLSEGKIITANQLVMQKTLLGWVVAGKSNGEPGKQSIAVTLGNAEDNVENLLKRFWELESVEVTQAILSKEEQFCETHYKKTTMTDNSGRFIVQLPFKQFPATLGDSYRTALQRMYSMEKRFIRDKEFATMYKSFMTEYIQLGHMKAITKNEGRSTGYYLPHHGVIKSSSSTTKLRVVFDGSAKSNTGKSLNDYLAVGPTIQSTLYDILLRFRKYKIAFTADVEKMFRQVLLAADDTKYHRILWRDTPEKPLKTYELQTVTYGTASASYLATRTLIESTEKHQESFPEAVKHIRSSMYVDDLMAGADTIESAVHLKDEINTILAASGFPLRKWLTNEKKIFTETSRLTSSTNILEIDESTSVKVLGLYWNPTKDCFQFQVNLKSEQPNLTKRGILSEASRLFDPLGWLSPITIKIKIFFQTLWVKNLDWDDQLPHEVATEWLKLRNNLPKIAAIEIERYIGTNSHSKIALHGFSDASRYAYAAVVYGEITIANGDKVIWLLSSKTKVAPVKQISIPRLELCGAVLLSKLLSAVKEALNSEVTKITAWTDSTIVLDWLAAHPNKWNTFVANRTGEILTNMNRSQWRHVASHDNPADYASRGVEPDKLRDLSVWWKGPKWLADPSCWPENIQSESNTMQEIRSQSLHTQIPQPNVIDYLIDKISTFSKIIRILAYVIRYINIKLKLIPKNSTSPYLLSQELRKPQYLIFGHIQSRHFELEKKHIASKKDLPASSKLIHLKPFLDEFGILRVGGRIINASITYDIKHPVILPANDKLTESIVREHHLRYLHAGQTLMIATLRQKYWIIGCRNLVRKVVHSCVKCTKYSGKELKQMMGDLPNPRVELVRPFFKVGVDYAGPFQTNLIRGRGQKSHKSYICIFVCLATKAIHIEVVSDLTTDSYIAALRRFVARRGIPKEIHSDNGTNFIGARNHLYELFQFLRQNINIFSNFLLADQITFKFIPPRSPHFGGLWEAAVKSVKYHLRRVTDGHTLTIEELRTLLVEIEAMLNSRPICVLSGDDMEYLTPAHFLIGRPTTQLPTEDLSNITLSKLSRWQMIEQMNQHIWKRWHLEYLTTLQHRNKWHTKENNIKIDDIVLIKEDNLPPSKWLMGKVIELYPGSDNNIRVVSLKTINGIIKRPIHKLCLLPVH